MYISLRLRFLIVVCGGSLIQPTHPRPPRAVLSGCSTFCPAVTVYPNDIKGSATPGHFLLCANDKVVGLQRGGGPGCMFTGVRLLIRRVSLRGLATVCFTRSEKFAQWTSAVVQPQRDCANRCSQFMADFDGYVAQCACGFIFEFFLSFASICPSCCAALALPSSRSLCLGSAPG